MRELLQRAGKVLEPLGYRRTKSAFSKVDAGIYRLIHFQKGAHGGGYFFVNLGIHPLGLPKLQTLRLVLPESPQEHECILRQRIEQVVLGGLSGVAEGYFRTDDDRSAAALIDVLGSEVQSWFAQWCDWQRLATSSEDVVSGMLTVVPRLKHKAFLMLRYFCLLRAGDAAAAAKALHEFMGLQFPDLDFSRVDGYLESLLA